MGKTLSVLKDRQAIVYFDGVCNLCSRFVQFLLKRDKDAVLKFASLQSEAGKRLLQNNKKLRSIDSVIFLNEGNVYTKSDAAIRILTLLPSGAWVRVFKIVPKVIRDKVYEYIAHNRYKIFGRSDTCLVPSQELKARFIS